MVRVFYCLKVVGGDCFLGCVCGFVCVDGVVFGCDFLVVFSGDFVIGCFGVGFDLVDDCGIL